MHSQKNNILVKILLSPQMATVLCIIVCEGLIWYPSAEIESWCQILKGPQHLVPFTQWHMAVFYKKDLNFGGQIWPSCKVPHIKLWERCTGGMGSWKWSGHMIRQKKTFKNQTGLHQSQPGFRVGLTYPANNCFCSDCKANIRGPSLNEMGLMPTQNWSHDAPSSKFSA